MCKFIQLWLRAAWDYSKADGGGPKQWHWIPVIKTHLTEKCHFKHSYMFFPDHFRSIISLATSRDSKPPSASLKEERGPKLIGGNANWTSVVITRVRGKAQEGKFCDSINRELGNSSQGLEAALSPCLSEQNPTDIRTYDLFPRFLYNCMYLACCNLKSRLPGHLDQGILFLPLKATYNFDRDILSKYTPSS
jgi:hypothetical protein